MTLIQRDESQTIGDAARVASSAVPYAGYRDPGHAEYQAAQRAVTDEFKVLLHQEYAPEFPDALHERIYTRADADGHASGWESIESEYEDYVLFAREVLEYKLP